MPIHATRLPEVREPVVPAVPWRPSSARYFATRLHGDGTETLVADELPLADAAVSRALSGPGGLSGSVPVEVARLVGQDGSPVLIPGRTAVYAESLHGAIVGGGILEAPMPREGASLSLDCLGFAGWPAGQPYAGDRSWIGIDPADLIRHAWRNLQARPGHDIGMVVDETTTDVRVGEEPRDVEFTTGAGEQVAFEAGPFRWADWKTHDMGKELDDLAEETPIDYEGVSSWHAGRIVHRLRLGHPRLGSRRHDLSFTVGVNVIVEPSVGSALDVSDVLVVGAGEGSASKRGRSTRSTGGLGRTVVVEDKTLTTVRACVRRAEQHLAWLSGGDEIESLTVTDHPNAPLGSWRMGDDIRVQGSGQGWAGDVDLWVRVLSDELDLETGTAVLSVTRSERTG